MLCERMRHGEMTTSGELCAPCMRTTMTESRSTDLMWSVKETVNRKFSRFTLSAPCFGCVFLMYVTRLVGRPATAVSSMVLSPTNDSMMTGISVSSSGSGVLRGLELDGEKGKSGRRGAV